MIVAVTIRMTVSKRKGAGPTDGSKSKTAKKSQPSTGVGNLDEDVKAANLFRAWMSLALSSGLRKGFNAYALWPVNLMQVLCVLAWLSCSQVPQA